jgi:hypothetical protein
VEKLKMNTARIIGSSILCQSKDGQEGMLFWKLAPHRHHHVIAMMRENGIPLDHMMQEQQGFLTSDGGHVSREEALMIAEKSNQIIQRTGSQGEELFSEDLW